MTVLLGVVGLIVGIGPVGAAADDHVTVRSRGFKPSVVQGLAAALKESRAGMPGGVLAGLWVPGQGAWVGAVGQANIARSQPMRPGLQMPVGSITKTLTTTLVLQEVQRGRIALDEPLSTWLPKYPKAQDITVAMLMNMSSGVPDYVNENFPEVSRKQREHPKRVWKPSTEIWGSARLPRPFEVPGTQFSYSNSNTVILGRILTKVTGRPLPQLMQRRILGPLGMTRTALDVRGTPEAPFAQNYSMLYGEVHGKPKLLRTTGFSLSLEGAAGGLRSTLRDMRVWGNALGTGSGVLSKSMQRKRLSKCVEIGSSNGLTAAYCLGTIVHREDSSGDIVAIWHNGRVLGSTGYLGYFPRTKAVLVVQSNQDGDVPGIGPIPDAMASAVITNNPDLVGYEFQPSGATG